jgi:hypothetical protein
MTTHQDENYTLAQAMCAPIIATTLIYKVDAAAACMMF